VEVYFSPFPVFFSPFSIQKSPTDHIKKERSLLMPLPMNINEPRKKYRNPNKRPCSWRRTHSSLPHKLCTQMSPALNCLHPQCSFIRGSSLLSSPLLLSQRWPLEASGEGKQMRRISWKHAKKVTAEAKMLSFILLIALAAAQVRSLSW